MEPPRYKSAPQAPQRENLRVGIDFAVEVDAQFAKSAETDFRQIVEELALDGQDRIEAT